MSDAGTERVEFASGGDRLVGTLHHPAGDAGPGPAVLVTGAWMTIKEQMPDRYAREMASRGLRAMTFDFAGWGESGCARRQHEDPARKVANIQAATAFLASRPDVDVARVGGLGICASSGYLVHAAAASPRLRAVALVAPWLHDAEVVRDIYGGADEVEALLAKGDAAEATYRSEGRQVLVPAASLTDESAIMGQAPYYTEPDRGMIPAWRNEADLGFWRGWLTFDAMTAAAALDVPFLMVESEAAAAPQGAHKFYAALTGPKEEVWLDGVSQFDFYDRPAPVTAVADAAARHFRAAL